MENVGILDVIMFFVMLIVSALIGVYFAYFAPEKQNTVSQYLMGGKTMGVFPISMSLVASYISGISILGLPVEMYLYGTQYSMGILTHILVCTAMAYIYIPVFYKLQITSSYEYLNRRFGPTTKIFGTVLFVLKQLLYIPIVIYVPALALNQVTGFHLHLITPIVCAICVFYTSLGGIKAVVWTDTFQILMMLLGLVVVFVLGVKEIGFFEVFNIARASGRLEFFNFDLDPRTRVTFWTMLIGCFFTTLASNSANQAIVQRCLSLPNVKKANISLGVFAIGYAIFAGFCCLTGLLIYATFGKCDPMITKKIRKADQLLPFFAVKIAKQIPGILGIFLSGVFSASLSTMSTGLNSMAGVIYEDIIKPMVRKPVSEAQASFIMKVIVVIIGVICVALVFVVEKMETVIDACTSLNGLTDGALLGLFTLGMFFPWANEKGALIGGITSLVTLAWISLNAQRHVTLGNIIYPRKPVSIEDCPRSVLNETIIASVFETKSPKNTPFFLFYVSYFWYGMMGTTITLVVGNLLSYTFGLDDSKPVDPDFLTPVVRRFMQTAQQNEGQKMKKLTDQKLETCKLNGSMDTSCL